MDEEQEPLVYTAKEAAAALSISLRHLSTLTSAGVIPHVRIGHLRRYPVIELKRWLAENLVTMEYQEE